MKKIYSLLTLGLISVSALAQTQHLGLPLSYSSKVELPHSAYKLPYVNNQQQAEYYTQLSLEKGEKMLQYGYVHEVNIDFFQHTRKQVLPNGKNLYQLALESPSAISLNVIFSQFKLAQGTIMYLFSADKSHFIGAYTSLNNNQANVLGTELIYNDRIVIEVQEPAENENKSQLSVGRVIHGFLNLDELVEKQLNDAGDCNIDVNCPQGYGWEIPRNGVAMLVNGGGGFCSGSMVNNTAGTSTPYFLTAAHCGGDPTNWVFRFRWESPQNQADCATASPSVNGPEDMNINGGTRRAYSSVSDFHLIELNSVPPSNWDVIYNGWDHTGDQPTSGAGIHHPSGDIKKIAISNVPFDSTSYGGTENHWKAYWAEGVTEGGSSGSPLFNQNRRVVGQLHGGASGCGSTDQSDAYGKFSASWNGGGTSATRLRDWLDPSNTGVGFIDANVTNNLDPFFSNQLIGLETTVCSGTVTPKIILFNGGSTVMINATINYSIDGVPSVYNWAGSLGLFESDTITLPTVTLSTGPHDFLAEVVNPNGTVDENLTNNILNRTITTIVGGAIYNLSLNLDCYANETSWQVVDQNSNILFQSPAYAATGVPYTVNESLCLNNGCYDFVINDSWGDGMSSSDCNPGSYTITDPQSNVLAELLEADANFGTSHTENFCPGQTNGLSDEMTKSAVTMYPNPFRVTLYLKSAEQINTVSIFDMSGKLVYKILDINQKEIQLNPEISTGLYTVQIETENSFSIKKLSKMN